MEYTSLSRIRLLLLATTMILGISASAVVSVRADGNLLRGFDVPVTTPFGHNVLPSIYWPVGVAFDGANLWYSQPCQCTSDIFETTTNGVLLKTLTEVNLAGALAWDGAHLWVGSFPEKGLTCTSGSTGCAYLTEVDVSTGKPIKVIDLSNIFAQDQECNFIDGLSYDASSGTFWVSPDIGCATSFTNNPCSIGFVYNVDSSGNLLKRIQMQIGIAGVANAGNNLYMVACPPPTGGNRQVIKTTLDGAIISSFATISVSGQRERAESLAFDPVTFAPACALWVVQDYAIPFDASLAAYQIACL
jgi:hypothetical protein